MSEQGEQSEQEVQSEFAKQIAARWEQIHEDLGDEAAGALRIGLNLIKIRDALKPLKRWLSALREHGMSQPQASRYIRYAELPERDRAAFQRASGFSLAAGHGEGKKGKKGAATIRQTNSPAEAEVEIPADELADALAQVERRIKLAIEIVQAGEAALGDEPQPPEYADDDERWRNMLRQVADAVHAVIDQHLGAELKQRLLPGRP
jgi:hypothetical protein